MCGGSSMGFMMPRYKILLFILSVSLCIGASFTTANANEGEGEAAAPEKSKVPPDAAEWYRRTQKLNVYESQVKDLTQKLQDLITKKNHGQTQIKDEKGNGSDILDGIVETHKKLVEAHKNYEGERAEIKYRYPGEGDLVERRYMPLRPPTLHQVEKELGLTGELTQLKKKIDQKYAPFVKKKPRPKPLRDDGPQATLSEKQPSDQPPKKRLKLEK